MKLRDFNKSSLQNYTLNSLVDTRNTLMTMKLILDKGYKIFCTNRGVYSYASSI